MQCSCHSLICLVLIFIQLHSQLQISSKDNGKLRTSIIELQKSNAELERTRSEAESIKNQLEKDCEQVTYPADISVLHSISCIQVYLLPRMLHWNVVCNCMKNNGSTGFYPNAK